MLKKILILVGIIILGLNVMAKEIMPPAAIVEEPIVLITEEPKVIEKPEITEEKNSDPKHKYRLVTTLFTRHPSNNDVYNNNTKLIAGEYFIREDFGIGAGYFENSFYNDSYIVTANKYFFPLPTKRFTLGIGAGIIKGYEKNNEIKNSKGEVVKSSKMPTNFGGDYMVGGALTAEYWVTDNIGLGLMYVGAYVGTISIRF